MPRHYHPFQPLDDSQFWSDSLNQRVLTLGVLDYSASWSLRSASSMHPARRTLKTHTEKKKYYRGLSLPLLRHRSSATHSATHILAFWAPASEQVCLATRGTIQVMLECIDDPRREKTRNNWSTKPCQNTRWPDCGRSSQRRVAMHGPQDFFLGCA